MSLRTGLTLAGAFAVAAISLPALASDGAFTTELSAQMMAPANPNNPKAAPKAAPRQAAPRQAAPRQAPMRAAPARVVPQRVAPATPRVNQALPRSGGQRNVGAPRNMPRVVAPGAPVTAAPRIITNPNAPPRVGGQGTGASRAANRAFTPRGNRSNVINAARIRNVPMRGAGRTTIQGRNYSVWRNGYRVRRGGGWRTFVALGALGTLAIGASQYYPYAYIRAPEPYCDGRTADGCQLVWEDVDTVEGDTVGQCVAYCPWQ